jgi:ectoine hydroxylase-related dioxygenase (phytanoyl-CoA dioxygenase family)
MREPLMGCKDQIIHSDASSDSRVQQPSQMQCVSFLYLDDVTSENGPVRVFPGSHNNSSSELDLKNEVKILAPKGSLIIMNANLRHGGTEKRLDLRRRVIYINYRDRRFRRQLNAKLFLNKKTIAKLSEAKKYLLGVRKTDSTKLVQTWAYYNRHDWHVKILIRLKIRLTKLIK